MKGKPLNGKLMINCLFFCCCCCCSVVYKKDLRNKEQIKPSSNEANPGTPPAQLESHMDPGAGTFPHIPGGISSSRATPTPQGAQAEVPEQPDTFGGSFPMLQTPGKDEEWGKSSTFCLSPGPEPGLTRAALDQLPVNWGRIRGQKGIYCQSRSFLGR